MIDTTYNRVTRQIYDLPPEVSLAFGAADFADDLGITLRAAA
jgi:hypothetical protein